MPSACTAGPPEFPRIIRASPAESNGIPPWLPPRGPAKRQQDADSVLRNENGTGFDGKLRPNSHEQHGRLPPMAARGKRTTARNGHHSRIRFHRLRVCLYNGE